MVDGRVHVVGSNERELRAAVEAAGRRPAASVRLSLDPRGSDLTAEVEIDLCEALPRRDLEAIVAVYVNGVVTPVARGENGGRTLHQNYVVQRLIRAGRLAADGPAACRFRAVIPIEPRQRAARIGVAAFVQDPESSEIFGSTSRKLARDGR